MEVHGPNPAAVPRQTVHHLLGTGVPDSYGVVPACGGQKRSRGGEIGVEDPAGMVGKGSNVCARLRVPECGRAVCRSRADEETVGTEPGDAGDGNPVDVGQVEHPLQVAQLPDVHLFVPAGAGEASAVGTEGEV